MVKLSKKNAKVLCYLDGRRQLLEDIKVVYNDFQFTVPNGYCCDSSSIPRLFWRICGSPTTGPNLLAGIVHDYCYEYQIFDRETCDKIFYEILIELDKPKVIAWSMFKAVRWFGKSHY